MGGRRACQDALSFIHRKFVQGKIKISDKVAKSDNLCQEFILQIEHLLREQVRYLLREQSFTEFLELLAL